jgi:hypothetical protein
MSLGGGVQILPSFYGIFFVQLSLNPDGYAHTSGFHLITAIMITKLYSIDIHANKKTVWDTMLNDTTYRIWAKEFQTGSYYEGSWEKGSEIHFMAPNDNGKLSGMYSFIKENRLHEFISIEHRGMIKDGIVDTTSPEVMKWAGALENYTFSGSGSQTTLLVEMQVPHEYETMFDETFPRALKALKALCER